MLAATLALCACGGSKAKAASSPGVAASANTSAFCAALQKENTDQSSGNASDSVVATELAQAVALARPEVKSDLTAMANSFTSATTPPDTAALQTSINNLVKYAENTCHFTPDTSGGNA